MAKNSTYGKFKLKEKFVSPKDDYVLNVRIYSEDNKVIHQQELKVPKGYTFDTVDYSYEEKYNGLVECVVIVLGTDNG